jgi:hypothetical protein
MSKIYKVFFSERNINGLLNYLGEQLNIPKTQKAKKIFEEVLTNQMTLIYEKNKEKLRNINPENILPKLNKKALEGTIKQYNSQIKEVVKKPVKETFDPKAMNAHNDDYGSPIFDSQDNASKIYSATGEIINMANMTLSSDDNNMEGGRQKNSAKEEIENKMSLLRMARDNNDFDIDENDANYGSNYEMQGFSNNRPSNSKNQPQVDEATRKFLGNICHETSQDDNNMSGMSNNMSNNMYGNMSNNMFDNTQFNFQQDDFQQNDYGYGTQELFQNNNFQNNNFQTNTLQTNTNILSYGENTTTNFLLNKKMKKKSNIEEIVIDKKKEIAYKHGLDIEKLMFMKPHEIDKLITKKKKVSTDSSEKSNIITKKEKLLECLKNKKKENKKYNEKLKNEITKIEPMLETRKQEKTEEIVIDTKNKKNTQKLNIKSSEWAEPAYYNNYQVELPNKMNISEFRLIGETDFPILRPAIDNEHNTLCIVQNNSIIPIELDEDDNYKLTEILKLINSALEENEIEIKISCNSTNNIIIEATNSCKFDLDLTKNSFGVYLGFQKKTYKNKTKYISENPHLFLDQSYFMFIKEISTDNPVCKITPEGKVEQLLTKLDNNNIIDTLTIQYRYTNDKKSSFVNFYGEAHSLSFNLISSNIDNQKIKTR